jgi:hypothetical protein
LTVQKYWLPLFKGRLLGDMTKKDIEAFMDSLDNRERKLSAARKNIIYAPLFNGPYGLHKKHLNLYDAGRKPAHHNR